MDINDVEIKRDPVIVFMGTPDFSVPVLEALIKNYKVKAVVTQPDKMTGRNGKITKPPVKIVAENNNILVIQLNKIRTSYQEILDLNPDLIVTCAYGQIIPKELLNFPKYGCINIHASLLPEYRGGAPIHKAVMDGKDKTGVTIMYMDEKMDSGDILYQEELEITSEDNTSTMFNKLSILGKKMIGTFIPKLIKGDFTRTPQDESKVTYAYNISKEDEKLSFSDNSINVFNKIRGLSDLPGAYAFLDNRRVKIFKSRIGTKVNGKPGEIISIYDDGIGVMTNDKEIIITDIQVEGKKREDVKSYLNGIQDKNKLIGKIFN